MVQLSMLVPHNDIAISVADETTTSGKLTKSATTSWQASTKKGTISGIAISVSGAGAWAKLQGSATFSLRNMSDSKTYQQMKTNYSIGGGVSAFFSWLSINGNAQKYKEEISNMFNEISQEQNVNGNVNIDVYTSGIYPNVEVSAMAYVLVLQITNDSGNNYNIFSTDDPIGDTGASDQYGKSLPEKDNNSMIFI